MCPTVSPKQMAHVEHECSNVSSAFEQLLIENGGRGTALLALQVLKDVDSPSIVILAGNNKNGALGLVAARHLINHGCRVTVCMTAKDDYVQSYVAMANKFGVTVRYDFEEEDADLIVDAILGPGDKLIDSYESGIEWANRQAKPILSIDFPSGVDADTGNTQRCLELTCLPKLCRCSSSPQTHDSSKMDNLSWCT